MTNCKQFRGKFRCVSYSGKDRSECRYFSPILLETKTQICEFETIPEDFIDARRVHHVSAFGECLNRDARLSATMEDI